MKSPWLLLALVCQASLSLGYLFFTPVFEAPDEPGHFLYARHLLLNDDLPLIPGTAEELGESRYRQSPMAHHPPLYYALLAATQQSLGEPDIMPTLRRSFAPDEPREPLIWAHSYDEVAPVSDEVRVFRILRGWSIVFGLVSLLLTHRLGRLLFPQTPGIADAGALMLACLPQWSFMHGVLDNGNMATALGAGVFVLLASSWRGRFAIWRGLLIGLLIGLALQTKMTSLFLVPLVGGIHVLGFWKRPAERKSVVLSLIASALPTLLIAGPFFLRNYELYADPLALSAHEVAYAASKQAPHRVRWFFMNRFPGETFKSFVADFGWGGISAPAAFYLVAKLVGALGFIGWLVRLRRPEPELFRLLLLGTITALVFAGLVRFNLSYRQAQGRYLFAGAGAFLLLVAAGLHSLWCVAGAKTIAARGSGFLLAVAAAGFLLTTARTQLTPPLEDHAHYAVLVAGLGREAPRPDASIVPLEPITPPRSAWTEASITEPPTFRWRIEGPREKDAIYSLHLFDPNRSAVLWEWFADFLRAPEEFPRTYGRCFGATWEQASILLEDGAWTLDPAIWEQLPRNAPIHWKIRRVPNRKLGENARDVEESASGVFHIAP